MTNLYNYIEVAVALPLYHTLTYRVPESLSGLASAGKRVLIPFQQRKVSGYILGPGKNTANPNNIKLILDVLDEQPLFPPSMIPFFKWIADYYLHPIGQVIQGALPSGVNIYDFTTVTITPKGEKTLDEDFITPLEDEILNCLKPVSSGPAKSHQIKSLCKKLDKNIPNALMTNMESKGLIIKKRELKSRVTKAKKERYIRLTQCDIPTDKFSESKKKIINAIKEKGEISTKALKHLVPTAPKLIRSLESSGYISIFQKDVYRDPFGDSVQADAPLPLTEEQTYVVSKLSSSLGKGFTTFLLAGVTGSGKTEVYMQVTKQAMNHGYSTLVLVPEIALISQTERRFRARFGKSVAVLHSGLSAGERYDQWMRIINKQTKIVIGARSAIFAPLSEIGVIIVDEEHDTSYKQESRFRYNARDLAVVRAKLQKCIALLGSATPSIQSWYNVKTNKFIELNLKERINKKPLPEISVVDLRKNRDKNQGINRFISSELHRAMKETLDKGEQVLLFLNRRGFATYPVCADCGEAVRCKNCNISLTLHKKINAYKCHLCGYTQASASKCKTCGSSRIKPLGLGTEKLEAAVKALFPSARTARMDRDTTTRKGSVLKILKGLRSQTIDILIGTQMVAKGHDFPNITLVGIICADLSLNFPDFRAGERTFQLLAQVAGRAGRGSVPGRVIMQTYNPDHFSITASKNQDFKAFYNMETVFRKALNYPPFSRIIQLKISGKDNEKTKQYALAVGDACSAVRNSNPSFFKSVEVLGPVEAPIPVIGKRFRWQILIKDSNPNSLRQFVQGLLLKNRSILNNRYVKTAVDVDPFSMM